MKTANKPNYGNWVAPRILIVSGGLAVVFLIAGAVLCLLTRELIALKAVVAAVVLFLLLCFVYFYQSMRLFSPQGGDIQNKVLRTLLKHIQWNGQGTALDIGCGSGALTIQLARQYPQAKVTGLDLWCAEWSFCKQQCETNAALEGVKDRVKFIQASAVKLPFADDTFDLVVSNLTFHEITDTKNKHAPIREALRVLKPGGIYIFQDLFLLKSYFQTPEALVAAVKDMGVQSADFLPTHTEPYIPKLLKLPFMLGAMGILRGVK